MKKCFFSTMFWVLVLALTPWYAQSQTISELLPLDGLNFFVHTDNGTEDCTVSYDASTQTIIYDYPEGVSSYGYAGWDFREGDLLDLSAFSSIVLHLADVNIDPPGSLEFAIKYLSYSGDVKPSVWSESASTISIALDPDAKNEVEYVYIKSEKPGTLRIDKITASLEGEMELLFSDLYLNWKGDDTSLEFIDELGIYYINFGGTDRDRNWIPWAYGWDGANFSEYDYVRIDFEEPCEAPITLSINYNPENVYVYPGNSATWPAGSSFVALGINHDIPATYEGNYGGEDRSGGGIRDIIIRSEGSEPTLLYLNRAYLAKGEVPEIPETPMADLIVTNISWEPGTLFDGAELNFIATVKNIGNLATPGNTKHGVVFRVYNNTSTEPLATTWSDNWYSSIEPGEEVLCKIKDPERDDPANGKGTGNLWTYWAAGGPYYVQAQVNDTHDVPESDESNNFSEEFFEITDLSGIQSTAVQSGGVFVENGVLKLTGYSPSATATVYNLQGQKLESNYVKNAVYIVKVMDNSCLSVHKVVAK